MDQNNEELPLKNKELEELTTSESKPKDNDEDNKDSFPLKKLQEVEDQLSQIVSTGIEDTSFMRNANSCQQIWEHITKLHPKPREDDYKVDVRLKYMVRALGEGSVLTLSDLLSSLKLCMQNLCNFEFDLEEKLNKFVTIFLTRKNLGEPYMNLAGVPRSECSRKECMWVWESPTVDFFPSNLVDQVKEWREYRNVISRRYRALSKLKNCIVTEDLPGQQAALEVLNNLERKKLQEQERKEKLDLKRKVLDGKKKNEKLKVQKTNSNMLLSWLKPQKTEKSEPVVELTKETPSPKEVVEAPQGKLFIECTENQKTELEHILSNFGNNQYDLNIGLYYVNNQNNFNKVVDNLNNNNNINNDTNDTNKVVDHVNNNNNNNNNNYNNNNDVNNQLDNVNNNNFNNQVDNANNNNNSNNVPNNQQSVTTNEVTMSPSCDNGEDNVNSNDGVVTDNNLNNDNNNNNNSNNNNNNNNNNNENNNNNFNGNDNNNNNNNNNPDQPQYQQDSDQNYKMETDKTSVDLQDDRSETDLQDCKTSPAFQDSTNVSELQDWKDSLQLKDCKESFNPEMDIFELSNRHRDVWTRFYSYLSMNRQFYVETNDNVMLVNEPLNNVEQSNHNSSTLNENRHCRVFSMFDNGWKRPPMRYVVGRNSPLVTSFNQTQIEPNVDYCVDSDEDWFERYDADDVEVSEEEEEEDDEEDQEWIVQDTPAVREFSTGIFAEVNQELKNDLGSWVKVFCLYKNWHWIVDGKPLDYEISSKELASQNGINVVHSEYGFGFEGYTKNPIIDVLSKLRGDKVRLSRKDVEALLKLCHGKHTKKEDLIATFKEARPLASTSEIRNKFSKYLTREKIDNRPHRWMVSDEAARLFNIRKELDRILTDQLNEEILSEPIF